MGLFLVEAFAFRDFRGRCAFSVVRVFLFCRVFAGLLAARAVSDVLCTGRGPDLLG